MCRELLEHCGLLEGRIKQQKRKITPNVDFPYKNRIWQTNRTKFSI